MTVNVHDHRPVFIDTVGLHGVLGSPGNAVATIILAFASATGRLGPRNNQLAEGLRAAGFGTLLLDLLSQREESDPDLAGDVELLAARLLAATAWLETSSVTPVPTGYLGTGLAVAGVLRAASIAPRQAGAIVSCGGRPDLAGSPALSRVRAPVQLIAGGRDLPALEASREAICHLRCAHELVVVPNAHHHFEDPGAIDSVVGHAAHWFNRHLA
ncbi:MAG: alpha/beta hydrolase [Sphingomonas sp.]|jgi:dienelactone hydrolase|uniref:alpha/beta hydrolase n=1 Tax=Sphingomonas sp. TaxID=28214 RepID=UPI00356A83F8